MRYLYIGFQSKPSHRHVKTAISNRPILTGAYTSQGNLCDLIEEIIYFF